MSIRTPISKDDIIKMKQELFALEQAFNLLDVHIVITDVNGNIVYANRKAEMVTGYSLSEMLGKNPGDLWGGNDDNALYEKMWKTIKIDKKPFFGRVKNKNKMGLEYVQELHITPLLDSQGNPKYFISMEPEVTIQSKIEADLVNKSRQITELMEMLKQNEQKISDLNKYLSAAKPKTN